MRLHQLSALSYLYLAIITTSLETAAPWPYNLPPHIKYYPEDEHLVRKENEACARLQGQQPLVVKKMSADPDEKFYLHYWSFDEQRGNNSEEWDNTTFVGNFEPALPLHAWSIPPRSQSWRRYLHLPASPAHSLQKRDFVCPSGTSSCASVNQPDVCCPASMTCQIVPDTGLGDVGCCDASETCAGSLSDCPSGYTSCPSYPGGGCCLPGFACYQEGCVQTSTTIVVASQSPTSMSSSSSSDPTTLIATTTVVVTPSSVTTASTSTQPSLTTSTMTDTITTTSTSLSSTANTLICSSGYRSCPASLGGGCCPTDRACGSVTCPALTSTATLAPPVRGTTDTNTMTTTSASLSSIQGCPTGFYACSAYYPGGCCQIGRDCHSTSCPANSGVTVVDSNSVTIVAPTGNCATGWLACAASVGGGCCPSGYACGTASCSATASQSLSQVGKESPNSASYSIARAAGKAWSLSIVCFVLSFVTIMIE